MLRWAKIFNGFPGNESREADHALSGAATGAQKNLRMMNSLAVF
jgi:hypothetical protein